MFILVTDLLLSDELQASVLQDVLLAFHLHSTIYAVRNIG